ncbi:MAG: type IV pili methyl-accepting chemotaxis transducer N-terminal domain-containing protein [Pseudomonadota bacterium]
MKLFPVVLAAMVAVAPTTGFTSSDQLSSANERINFSGKLRMLSQRMAAAGCNLNAGVDTTKSAKIISGASVEFSNILAGLQTGSADLRIEGVEANPAVLAEIANVDATFQQINDAITTLVTNPDSVEGISVIKTQNLELLEAAKALVAATVSVYADTSVDALGATIDVAGRQRMLTQKMSKEACLVMSGDATQTDALAGTMDLFETSLNDLINGANGMVKTPNLDIASALNGLQLQWDAIKPTLEQVKAGAALDTASRAVLASELDTILREMNRTVGLYVIAKQSVGLVNDIGATERVNFAGKLRMLSQRVAAAACNYASGVDPENNRDILLASQSEFQKITRGLEFGDADLRIVGEESRSRTVHAIRRLNDEWANVSLAIDKTVQGDDLAGSVELINDRNMEVLGHAKLLASEIAGQYSDPAAMLLADAMLIDISGRQRMLTQKMSKEACLVWDGDAAAAEALTATMQTFEASLLALRDGLPAAGINPAPTEDIHAGLEDIYQEWTDLKPQLEAAAQGEAADTATRTEVTTRLNVMLKDMNAVVGLYTIFGKTGI